MTSDAAPLALSVLAIDEWASLLDPDKARVAGSRVAPAVAVTIEVAVDVTVAADKAVVADVAVAADEANVSDCPWRVG